MAVILKLLPTRWLSLYVYIHIYANIRKIVVRILTKWRNRFGHSSDQWLVIMWQGSITTFSWSFLIRDSWVVLIPIAVIAVTQPAELAGYMFFLIYASHDLYALVCAMEVRNGYTVRFLCRPFFFSLVNPRYYCWRGVCLRFSRVEPSFPMCVYTYLSFLIFRCTEYFFYRPFRLSPSHRWLSGRWCGLSKDNIIGVPQQPRLSPSLLQAFQALGS